MKHRNFKIEWTKSDEQILMILGFSTILLLFLTSVSLASDESDNINFSNQSNINTNVIKENYSPDTKSIEVFDADLVDMDPREIANNIENISNKYNIDINNISENIAERNSEMFNEDIIVQSPDEEKILLIRLSGKITIVRDISF